MQPGRADRGISSRDVQPSQLDLASCLDVEDSSLAVRVEHHPKRGGIAALQLDPQLDFAVPRRELGLPPPAEFLDGLRVLVVNVPE